MRTFFVLYFSALFLVPVALLGSSRTVPFAVAGIQVPTVPKAETMVLPEVKIVGSVSKPKPSKPSKPKPSKVAECWPSQFKGSAAHPACF